MNRIRLALEVEKPMIRMTELVMVHSLYLSIIYIVGLCRTVWDARQKSVQYKQLVCAIRMKIGRI